MATLPDMFSVGMVLSAGGSKGDPWHSAVVSTLAERVGWDARSADLLVGTSAGSYTASALRAGLPPTDCERRFLQVALSESGQAIHDRIVTRYEEPVGEQSYLPSAPSMTMRALMPPWKLDPIRALYGVLPPGKRSGAAIASRIDELHPDGWPAQPTWIVAVRTNDGRRIVFGRDDVKGSIGQAAQASSAIPMVYQPVKIGTREYVDGAVHSSTNADLTAMLGFDLVVVSSVKTAAPDARGWRRDPERAWFSSKLDAEVDAIRRRGTAVVVIEPGETELALMDADGDDLAVRAAQAGRAAALRALDDESGSGVIDLLARAAGAQL